jgi:hypothetical protein
MRLIPARQRLIIRATGPDITKTFHERKLTRRYSFTPAPARIPLHKGLRQGRQRAKTIHCWKLRRLGCQRRTSRPVHRCYREKLSRFDLLCLRRTKDLKDCFPMHPLYVAAAAEPTMYPGRSTRQELLGCITSANGYIGFSDGGNEAESLPWREPFKS